MMIRLLSNSICLGLLTTLTGVVALLKPVQANQAQAEPSTSVDVSSAIITTPDLLAQATDDVSSAIITTPDLLAQATDDLPRDILDLDTLPVEEDPGEAEGFIDGTIIRQVPSTLPPLVDDELGDDLALELTPTGDSFIPADGRSTLGLRGSILDSSGQPIREDVVVTLTSSAGTFVGADYDIDRGGFQTLARQGEFEVELRSSLDAQNVTIRASVDPREALGLEDDSTTARQPAAQLDAYQQVNFIIPYRPSLVAGVLDLRLGSATNDIWGRFADFLDPDDLGDFEADVDASIFATSSIGEWLLTAAFNSDRGLNERCDDNRLFRDVQACDEQFPTTGDSSTTDFLTPSIDSFYVRFERDSQFLGGEPDFFMWGDYDTSEFSRFSQEFSATNRQLHGFKGNYTFGNGLQLTALYANDLRELQRDTIVPDGTSGFYFLSQRVILGGSEDIFFELEELNRPGVVVERVRLIRGVDYTIDYDRGTLLFNSPVAAVDANPFGPALVRRIVATYQVDTSEAEGDLFGGRLQYNFDASLESPSWVGASAIFEDLGAEDFNLVGVDALVSLGDKGRLVAEVARSSIDSPLIDEEGVAVRVEATGSITPDLAGTAYFRNTESGFRNTATTSFRPGQTRWGGQLGYNLSENTQLQVQFDRERNRGNQDEVPTTLDELLAPGLFRPVGDEVDNSLTTVRAGVQQQLGALTANLDYVYRDRNDSITGADFESSLLSGGLTWPIAKRFTLRAQTDIALSDEDELYPGQTAVGIDWAAIPELLTFRVAQRFFHDSDVTPDALTTIDTLINYDLTDNTLLTGRYSLLGGNNGVNGQGSVGLNHRVNLAPGLHADLGFQQIFGTSISSITGGDQFIQPFAVGQSAASLGLVSGTTYTLGLEYTDNPDFQASVRLEHRDSEGGNNTVATASAAGNLTRALTTLARIEHANFGNQIIADQLNSSTSALLGLAYRNPHSDKFNGLLSYEYAINPASTPNSLLLGAGGNTIVEHTLAAEGIYAPSWRWELFGKYALRATNADLDSLDVSSNNTIHLAQFKVTRRFSYRWDVTGEVRYITQPETNFDEVGVGFQIGYFLTPELRVGAGYSFGSVNDRSLGGSGFRSDDGPFLSVTFKINELFDRFGLQPVAPPQQEESLVDADGSPPPDSVSNGPAPGTAADEFKAAREATRAIAETANGGEE